MTRTRNQSGFSLVELMVVVAIIGVLATIAIPRVNRFIAKSRQSEAQVNLSSLYTFNKNFYVEFNGYTDIFGMMGFKPEGNLRYNVGFSSAVGGPASFTALKGAAAVTAAGTTRTTLVDCPPAGTNARCRTIQGATNANPGAITAAAVAANFATFTAQARSQLIAASVEDTWEITNNKNLRNTADGTVETD